ncbi:MAG: hypothetical protein AB1345_07560 [Chloroflexota bacterium]
MPLRGSATFLVLFMLLFSLALAACAEVLPMMQAEPLSALGVVTEIEEEAPFPSHPFLPTPTLAPLPTLEAQPLPLEAPTPVPAIPEKRMLTLEWPAEMRVGDADIVRLSLEVDESGKLTPTAEIAGHEVIGEAVEIPNLYETHHILAQARLDMAGVQLSPSEAIIEPLRPGEKVTFYWSIRLGETGTYRGTVWLHLRFIPKDGGPEVSQALSAQLIEIQASSFLGLKGPMARLLGGLSALLGSVISLPDILGWLARQIRRQRNPS